MLAQERTGRRRYSGSSAEHLWLRLHAVDFVNRGMLTAAVLLLCFVPFAIVATALAGRSAFNTLVRRYGLDPAAAQALSSVFTSPRATVDTVTGASWLFFVISGLTAAGAV